jgi:hypothetical protein
MFERMQYEDRQVGQIATAIGSGHQSVSVGVWPNV